jgi:hypothetical protein
VSPHYDRHSVITAPNAPQNELGGGPDEDAMDDAAQALRQAEVEAVQPDISAHDRAHLENMSIDELRALAASLDVPDRATITEQDDLIAAIKQRL